MQHGAEYRVSPFDADHRGVGVSAFQGRESLDHLDILAFVPCSEQWPVAMEEDGIRPVDHSYRDAVDAIFKQIYREGRFGVMPEKNAPRLIELCGSREQRLEQLASAIADLGAATEARLGES
jgi:hypothetical protein